jgi:CspA family cold shock protein
MMGRLGSSLCPFLASRRRDVPLLAHARHPWDKENLMITGTVKFFNNDKGYGFIAPENGNGDAFVHISAVERAGMTTLNKDQRLSYELETDRRGKTSAVNLQAA